MLSAKTARSLPGRTSLIVLGLFFASGFAALVYQVLWVRQLGLLFGSTAQAASLTIAIFFAGLALGGWFWGRRAARMSSALVAFGALEIGIAVAALGHFALLDTYHALYPALHATLGSVPAFDTAAKALIATVILLPPAFLMGGTLPAMTQHLVSDRGRLGRTGSALYAVNTAGSAIGALAAGFVLPLVLGFRSAYLLAVGLDLVVGFTAVLLDRRTTRAMPAPSTQSSPGSEPAPAPPRAPASLPTPLIWTAAAASGFATLAIEVVWTRLFAQVLQNSVYTYSLVLSTFLVALALGASLAHSLCRLRRVDPEVILGGLLVAAGAVTAVSPWVVDSVTNGLAYAGADRGWSAYVVGVAAMAVPIVLLPGMVLGAVLPYMLRILQTSGREPGDAVGRLVAANTAGAIVGSLAAGFLLLPWVGAWRSLLVLAAVYPALVATVALHRLSPPRVAAAGLALASMGVLVAANPQGLETIRLQDGERLLEVREGSQATVAVIGNGDDRLIRVNNSYTLGSTRALDSERDQTVIPLLIHPEPRSVFYLGMGTGLSAGAALAFPVERVVVCELIGDVVNLANAHFEPWIGGLFADERVEVHAEDGRNCLRRSAERFDLVISDLFTPWHAGTGNLYTVEHFRTVRDRLEPGGLFVQWIPLYEVSDQELGIIARTMDEVFGQVVMWRGDLFPRRSIIALVGQIKPTPLDPSVPATNARRLAGPDLSDAQLQAMLVRLYAGNVTESGLFSDRKLNTDNHPLIEYMAPRTHRRVRAGEAEFLVGWPRERLYADLRADVHPDQDPYLSLLTPTQLGYVDAGWGASRAAMLDAVGSAEQADQYRDLFIALSPPGSTDVTSPARILLPRITDPSALGELVVIPAPPPSAQSSVP